MVMGHNMEKFLLATAALALPSVAQAAVLTFDGNICHNGVSGGQACGNFSLIDQAYGDAAGVDVQTRYDSTLGATQNNAMQFWDTAYNELINVAFGTPSANRASVFLASVGGSSITLNSFNLGAWPSTVRNTSFDIFDGLGNTLFSSGSITVGTGNLSSLFNVGLTSSNGIGIVFGPDSYNVGIDNIDFTVTPGTGPIPEPASWAMMIAGFGLAGAAMRRRAKVSVTYA
jgi:hypothetical protein